MAAPANRILRFFTISSDDYSKSAYVAQAAGSEHAPLTAVDRANERLLGEISEFLISCRLSITTRNLLIAHSIFNGDDPQLAREIGRRRLSGEAISQEWLDAQTREENPENKIRTLITQLEDSLDRFANNAKNARASTADCNAVLAGQVDRATVTPESITLADVLAMANTILEHSRKLEADIRASEQETRTLRERLGRAQRDAQFDHLTGLPNRRAFEAAFNQHYREAQAEVDLLCVAFCDVDHFKLVNDKHGHETGDRVLKAIAETLNRLSNEKCHVARHGGEEFALLFRGLTKDQVREKLDAVRETFSARRFVNRINDDPIGCITFSGGVADVFAYDNPRDALRAADEALYLAKEKGRNAVITAP